MTIEMGMAILVAIVIVTLLIIFVLLSEIIKDLEHINQRLKSCSIDVAKTLALVERGEQE